MVEFFAEYWLPDYPNHIIKRGKVKIEVTGKDSTPPIVQWIKVSGDNVVQAKVYDNNNVLKDTVNVYANGLYVGDAPQTQIGLSGNYHFLEHFSLGLNWVYYDRLYADFNPVKRNNPDDREQSFRIPSYHVLDAHFVVDFRMFGQEARANLSCLNMLNSKRIIRGMDGTDHTIDSFRGFWGFGRTISVGLKLCF